MKKITFILFALIAGTAFGQATATGKATAAADIVSPISISDGTKNLNFGKIVKDANGGTVIIPAGGNRSGTAQIVAASTYSAAEFTVNASNTYNYIVTLPADGFTITNGAETMELNGFVHNLGATPSGTGNDQTLLVGATLTVGPSQAEGNYSGTMNVTVAYQ